MVAVVSEVGRLEALEHEHEHGRLKAVDALRKIHDEGLYKFGGHKSWEEYLKKRWNYSKTYGRYLIGFARLRDDCKKQGVEFLPENEAQARPIVAVAARKKIDSVHAWQVAVDMAPKKQDVPQITQQHVESVLAHQGFYRNAKRKTDTKAHDMKQALTRVRQIIDDSGMTGYEFCEKYKDKGLPNGFRRVVDFMVQCAEVSEVQ